MYFYYFTIIFLFCFSLYETERQEFLGKIRGKGYLVTIVTVIFILQLGLRWETGSDWIPYLDHFQTQNLLTPTKNFNYNFESGYNAFVTFIKSINNNYSFFLFVHAIIFFVLLRIGFTYFTNYSLTGLLVFYVTFLGLWGANRQFIALAIGLVALILLDKGKIKVFVCMVAFACLFHATAFLLLIFLFLNRTLKYKWIFIALAICCIIGLSSLPFKIFGILGGVNDVVTHRTEAYLQNAKESGNVAISAIGILKRILLFSIFLFYRDKINALFPKNNILFNGYFVGLCFYFLFFKSLPVMISRGSVYFNILEPILIANLLILFKDKRQAFLVQILILLYCFLTLHQSIAAYPDAFDPYKGILFNQDYKRIHI